MEWAPGENGVVVVALAVVVVELAIIEVVEPATDVVLAAEDVVELSMDVVVVVIIDVVVVVFFAGAAETVPVSNSKANERKNRQAFFIALSPLLIEIHCADARGNVARGIAG